MTHAHRICSCILGVLLSLAAGGPARAEETIVFDVRDYGAVGDGKMLDTIAINKAVEACAAAGGG